MRRPPRGGDPTAALSAIALRQEYVRRLQTMVPAWRKHAGAFVEELRLLRGVSVDVVEAIVAWRGTGAAFPFLFEGENYLIRMLRDTDFLAKVPQLSDKCSVTFACNPFFEALPLLSRNGRPRDTAAVAAAAAATGRDETSHRASGPSPPLRCSAELRYRIGAARGALLREWHVHGTDAAVLVSDRVRAKIAAAVGEAARSMLSRTAFSTRHEFERNVRVRGVHLLPMEWEWLHSRATRAKRGVDHAAVQRFLATGTFADAQKRAADLRTLMKPLQLPSIVTPASKHTAEARARQLEREMLKATARVRKLSRDVAKAMAESSHGATGGGDAAVDAFNRRWRADRLSAQRELLERERREAGALAAALAAQRKGVRATLAEWEAEERTRYDELAAELAHEEARSDATRMQASAGERLARLQRSLARNEALRAAKAGRSDRVATAAAARRTEKRVVGALAQRAAKFRGVLHRKVARRAMAKACGVACCAATRAEASTAAVEIVVNRLAAIMRHPLRAAKGVLRLSERARAVATASARGALRPGSAQPATGGVEATVLFAHRRGPGGGAVGTVALAGALRSAEREEGAADVAGEAMGLRLVRVAVAGRRALRLTVSDADVMHPGHSVARVLDLPAIGDVLRDAETRCVPSCVFAVLSSATRLSALTGCPRPPTLFPRPRSSPRPPLSSRRSACTPRSSTSTMRRSTRWCARRASARWQPLTSSKSSWATWGASLSRSAAGSRWR